MTGSSPGSSIRTIRFRPSQATAEPSDSETARSGTIVTPSFITGPAISLTVRPAVRSVLEPTVMAAERPPRVTVTVCRLFRSLLHATWAPSASATWRSGTIAAPLTSIGGVGEDSVSPPIQMRMFTGAGAGVLSGAAAAGAPTNRLQSNKAASVFLLMRGISFGFI